MAAAEGTYAAACHEDPRRLTMPTHISSAGTTRNLLRVVNCANVARSSWDPRLRMGGALTRTLRDGVLNRMDWVCSVVCVTRVMRLVDLPLFFCLVNHGRRFPSHDMLIHGV